MSKQKIYDYFVLVYKPGHSRAVSAGYVPEQYLVAEKELGRPLSPDEDVRHINGNTQDNRSSNLEIISLIADYKAASLSEDADYSKQKGAKNYMACKFQKPCWKEIRAPIARGKKVYLPYICSYQTEGDIYKCGHFWTYIDKEMENQKSSARE